MASRRLSVHELAASGPAAAAGPRPPRADDGRRHHGHERRLGDHDGVSGGGSGCGVAVDADRLLQRQQAALIAAQERIAELELELLRAREREAQLVLAGAPDGSRSTTLGGSSLYNKSTKVKSKTKRKTPLRAAPTGAAPSVSSKSSSAFSSTPFTDELFKWGERELQNTQHALRSAQAHAGSLEVENQNLRTCVHDLEARLRDLEAENRVALDYMLRQKVYTERGPCDDPEIVAEHVEFLRVLLKERDINFPVAHLEANVYLFRDSKLHLVVHQGRLLVQQYAQDVDDTPVYNDFLELLAKRPESPTPDSP